MLIVLQTLPFDDSQGDVNNQNWNTIVTSWSHIHFNDIYVLYINVWVQQ